MPVYGTSPGALSTGAASPLTRGPNEQRGGITVNHRQRRVVLVAFTCIFAAVAATFVAWDLSDHAIPLGEQLG
jgi:hypothetical protein